MAAKRPVTIGGKGCPLYSADVYDIAKSSAIVYIDASVLKNFRSSADERVILQSYQLASLLFPSATAALSWESLNVNMTELKDDDMAGLKDADGYPYPWNEEAKAVANDFQVMLVIFK